MKIILFCLKIYDVWRPYHLWVGGWVYGRSQPCMGRSPTHIHPSIHPPHLSTYAPTPGSFKSLKWNASWTNRDNLILFADV